MTQRIVSGLISAQLLTSRPKCIPQGRPRGAKAAGIRYQKAFGQALGTSALDGPWFSFVDALGAGLCQPDFLLNLPSCVVVLECKYTWTPLAWAQIEALYLPVVAKALNKPAFGLQVCKRLLPQAVSESKIVARLGNGLILANHGARVTLHWIENTPVSLVPSEDQLLALNSIKRNSSHGEYTQL